MTEVIFRPLTPLNHKNSRHKGPVNTRSEHLAKGYQYQKGALRLPCEIIVDRDVPLKMRDGVTIYADVFRPATGDKVPAIINWAPYGKGDTGYWTLDNSEMFPNRFGVKRGVVSGLQSWEGNDPAYWCNHGYAVVQIDARGAFNSEGDIWFLNLEEGKDGHDAVEALASKDWCSGRIGLAGNSWLAMTQWRIAVERPKHLCAIAPWEGLTDPLRNSTTRGGIPDFAFPAYIRDQMFGSGRVEDIIEMAEQDSTFNDYWAEKVPDVASIGVPAYVVASYSNPVHPLGTFRGWSKLTSPKWLRINNTHEWPDFYTPKYMADLHRFFDHYLKEIHNGWETDTPPVRVSVLDPGHEDIVDRPEDSFPPEQVEKRAFYLDARDGSLTETLPKGPAQTRYELSEKLPEVTFTMRFDQAVEVIGCPILSVFVSAQGHDDLDLFAYIEKLDRKGKQLWHQTVDLGLPAGRWWMPKVYNLGLKLVEPAFFRGANGMLRVSRRGLDTEGFEDFPDVSLREVTPLNEGEIVQADIPFWPVAMRWHEGEQLRLKISGKNLLPVFLPGLPPLEIQPGKAHVFHTGEGHPSNLILPMCRV